MNDDSSEARNSTAFAISSGSPKRPIGHVHEAARGPLGVLGEQLLEQRGVHRAGAQRVDAHALAGELHAELAGHREHAALGRGVGDLRGRRAHHRDERRGVDDRAALLLEHVGQRGLAAQVDAGQVDLLHPPPGLEVGVEDRVVVGRADAGVVEGDVDRAVGVLRRSEERVDLAPCRSRRRARTSRRPRRRAPRPARRRASSSMSPMTTLAPSSTNRRTVARPMPEQPPVTTATRPSMRPANSCSFPCRGLDGLDRRRVVRLPSQVAMKTFFSSVNAYGASGPSSRPRPDCL